MANYAIRVELKGNPSYEEYETLHALMANFGFYQTIKGASDATGQIATFNLPHAMYYGSSGLDCSSLRRQIQTAIKAQVQNDIIIFVVQVDTWSIGY